MITAYSLSAAHPVALVGTPATAAATAVDELADILALCDTPEHLTTQLASRLLTNILTPDYSIIGLPHFAESVIDIADFPAIQSKLELSQHAILRTIADATPEELWETNCDSALSIIFGTCAETLGFSGSQKEAWLKAIRDCITHGFGLEARSEFQHDKMEIINQMIDEAIEQA